MNTNLLFTFIILNIINVIIQTIKSIATVKCKKTIAAIVNAVAYGLYTVVVVYTVCDLPLICKVAVVALCNLIGVFFVKWLEEKSNKDKLWKVEATISKEKVCDIEFFLKSKIVPSNYIDIGKYVLVNFYCANKESSAEVKNLLNLVDAKYFVSESKIL